MIKIIKTLFGILFTLIGLINLFWGNDPYYGLFVLVLSLLFYTPISNQFQKIIPFKIKRWHRILIGLLILWTSIGVAELFDKIELMKVSFKKPTLELVWADEFDNEGVIDSNKWIAETTPPNSGSWYNDELQHYTDSEINAFVSEGTLKIVAIKEPHFNQTQKEYTSARLNSKFHFTYGKVEVRAKLPKTAGTWPAIWCLAENINDIGWPASGEIDIMEQLFEDQLSVQSAVHTTAYHGANASLKKVAVSNVTENFHVYGLEWTEDALIFLVDDNAFFTYSPIEKTPENWPFNSNQFILLNVAIGGNLGGDVDPNFIQDQMEIDYVRVYQWK